jgi:hypothetical protein
MREPVFDKSHQFLEPWVGKAVDVVGEINHHGYLVMAHGRGVVRTCVLVALTIETPDGVRRQVGHLHVPNAHGLAGVRAGTRVRFCGRVMQYVRKSGTVSWSLSSPYNVSFVAQPQTLTLEP